MSEHATVSGPERRSGTLEHRPGPGEQCSAPAAGALRARLRSATGGVHRELDRVVGSPELLRCPGDHARLLATLHQLHTGVEEAITRPAWAPHWSALGIDPAEHVRTPALAADLADLRAPLPPRLEPGPALAGFAEHVGALYVVAGSALGGPPLAARVLAAVPGAPVRFLAGTPAGTVATRWRAVLAALDRFTSPDGTAAVVRGAGTTFAWFGDHLLPACGAVCGTRPPTAPGTS